MKILIIMDPGILIPVKGYGGHERLAEMFAKEYSRMGHEVHLLVTCGSMIPDCTVHNFGKEGFPPKKRDAIAAIPVAWKFLWKHRKRFDLVHNFGRLAYLIPILNQPVKKIMTYGREINQRNIRIINKFNKKNIVFTGCSHNLLSRINTEGNWEVVYNAVEFDKYKLQEHIGADSPLIFLGRIERVKGCHTAIKVAKATSNKLIIAGNISPLAEENSYFENEIKPHIDGVQIQYVGEVNDVQKNEYLGQAKALLLPIEWNEPFGIVMIEAMACGTPVIGYRQGSVSEVIDEGITGYKVNDFSEMLDGVKNINSIDRSRCRQHAKKRFDVEVIAEIYLQIIKETAKRIVIITTSNPTANPRVVKEYETLLETGYKIKVLYCYNAYWSYKNDQITFAQGVLKRRDFVMVGGNPFNEKLDYFISRILFKISRNIIGLFPFMSLRKISTHRGAFFLEAAAKKYKADMYIAHYLGSLPAAMNAAKKYKGKVIFDAEDFHRGEDSYFPNQIKNVITIEEYLLPKIDIITTASPLISASLKKLFPLNRIYTINNVFSKKFMQNDHRKNKQQLRLFWFSQNIGPNRGLEIFIETLNLLHACDIDLTIMGTILSVSYWQKLLGLANDQSRIFFEETVPPDEIFSRASHYDIGLAGEIPNMMNKDVCLSNKIFTYLPAGNCLVASDTAGQKYFLESNPGIGLLYKHDDAADLASKIKMLYDDRPFLEACKKNALYLSATTLNWEKESEKLKAIISSLVGDNFKQPGDPGLKS